MKDENPFRQKLYHHTLPVRDDLWTRIESQLPAIGTKKKFPFFMLSIAAVVTITSAVIFAAALKDNKQQQNTIQEKMETPATSPDKNISNIDKSLSPQSLIKDETHINPSSPSSSTQIAIQDDHHQNVIHQNVIHQNVASLHQKLNQASNEISYSENTAISTSDVPSGSYSSLTQSTNSNLSDIVFTNNRITHLYATESLPLAEIEFISTTELAEDIMSLKPDPNCYKYSGSAGKTRMSLDLFVGPGFSPRTFSDTGSESALYADARRATERNTYSWSGGARINYNINHEFSVRGGLMYEQTGDVFDYIDTLATKRTTRIDSFFSANGTFLYTETKTELILGTQIKKIHNRYHHVDIPLLVSYELPMGRSTLMANIGPVLNLTTSFRGQILDPGLIPQYITPGESNQLQAYKTNVGLSIYLGAGALLPLTDHIAALIEPRFLFRINPVTLDTYPIKEHRHFAGLNLGIRYHFK